MGIVTFEIHILAIDVLTFGTLAYYMLRDPLKCALAGIARAYFSGYFNNNDDRTNFLITNGFCSSYETVLSSPPAC